MKIAHSQRKRLKGFTLIELMVVVAIVAILSAIAIPSYLDYVTRSKLSEAYNTLSAFRVSMEQYYQDNRAYTAAGGGCGVAVSSTSLKYFTVSCTPATGATVGYYADANGIAGSQVAGFDFRVDNTNARSTQAVPAGWSKPNPNTCWVVRKGGGCQ